jgi:hypothetical protein
LYAGKDIENRTWKTDYCGEVLIHAGKLWDDLIRSGTKKIDPEMFELVLNRYDLSLEVVKSWARNHNKKTWIDVFPLGGIVGKIEIVDCVQNSQSKWAVPGQWQWVLKNPEPLPFHPCKGQLGFFEVKYGQTKTSAAYPRLASVSR